MKHPERIMRTSSGDPIRGHLPNPGRLFIRFQSVQRQAAESLNPAVTQTATLLGDWFKLSVHGNVVSI